MNKQSSFTSSIMILHAILDAFKKLNPIRQARNPVMFVTEIGSIFTTVLWIQALLGKGESDPHFIGTVAIWLWFTVLFANYSKRSQKVVVKPRPNPYGKLGRILLLN
jgi:K+-transporting ATPase ATPase B chain